MQTNLFQTPAWKQKQELCLVSDKISFPNGFKHQEMKKKETVEKILDQWQKHQEIKK